ncbi:MAG: SDR family oxidoreductase [Microcoleus sp.]
MCDEYFGGSMGIERNSGRMSLEGRKTFITGGAQGIGEAVAELFLEEGSQVVIADTNAEVGKVTVERLEKAGYENIYFELVDVRDHESVAEAMGNGALKMAGITTIIANAGITADRMMSRMTYEQWQNVIDVNLTGVFNTCKEALPYLRENGKGEIVAASSVARSGNVGQTNYSATKAGVRALVNSLAREQARNNIRVNAVAPGFIRTPMTDKMPPETLASLVADIPLGRMGDANEVARVYGFLASDASSYLTGTIIEADGGLVIGTSS